MSTTPEDPHATKSDLQGLEQRLTSHLESAFKQLRDYIDERTRDMQTEVLRAFANYQQSQDIRFARLKADVGNIDTSTDQRLTVLEQRVHSIEKRLLSQGPQ